MGDEVKKSVDSYVKRLDDLLHDENFWLVKQMNQLEEKTGVKRVHIALGKYNGATENAGPAGK